jgi:Lantibiotic dehydratase, N terminus
MATTRTDPRLDPGADATRDLMPLAGDWALWRDFAVRSAGFPVTGLDAFGPGDESARLRGVARDPLFREAVTWQNPAALANAVARVAAGDTTAGSKARRREEVVASYWQRYCAKNDTIGFFGPLAWGRIDAAAPPLAVRSGALVRERAVHLEAWGVQALAETIDPELRLPTSPHTERDLRHALEAHPDAGVRARGLDALRRLEAARDGVASAPPTALPEALAVLDDVFVALTGRAPTRNHGRAYGARTLAYVDCMRDLDVTVGRPLVADLAPALQLLFEGCRWYCGEVNAVGSRIVAEALPPGGRGPFAPVLGRVVKTLIQLPPELADVVAELHRRLAALLADPEPATIGARAALAFADRRRAWRTAAFQSVDVQLAARDAHAVARGDYLAVVGDVHAGANPLLQGLFAHRHPDPAAMLRRLAAALGPGIPLLLPPYAPGLGVEARGVPLTPEDAVHIAVMPDTRAPAPRRTWLPHELLVDGDDLVDRSGRLRVPLLDAFGMPIFIAGVRAFELLPDAQHARRETIGRVVLRRESWRVPSGDVPDDARQLAAFARDRGMPRRLFAKSPLERKPMYVDVESPALARILCRHARQAAHEAPAQPLRFSEMLPAPDGCWVADPEGNRYVSELRLVAVDRGAVSSGSAPARARAPRGSRTRGSRRAGA